MIGITEAPLSGVRVISLEQYGAGPYASMYLSDLGAEVIKIEPPARDNVPGGDSSRQSGPHFLGQNDSHFFQTFNLGKKSLSLDITHPEGRKVLEKLVATADIVMNNMRGDLPEKFGITYADLCHIKPSIVCAHLSGYGRRGARKSWPAYDFLMQAEAGHLSVTGEPDGPPTRMGLSIVDFMTGTTLAFATTAALFGASRSGKGMDVDVTLYDVAMHQLTYPAVWYLNEGDVIERRPRSGHPAVVPCEVFPTADGHIFIMCILPKFWKALCSIVGLDDLPEDPRFAKPADRFANRGELSSLLDERLRTATTSEWMTKLSGRVPSAPVLTLPQALDNPYFAEQDGIQTIRHPERDGLRVLSNPIRINQNRAEAKAGPALGADTETLLAEMGLSAADVAALRDQNVI